MFIVSSTSGIPIPHLLRTSIAYQFFVVWSNRLKAYPYLVRESNRISSPIAYRIIPGLLFEIERREVECSKYRLIPPINP